MKEYKLIECQKTEAEQNMNVMAAQGWELHSVTYWTKWNVCLLLTFGRSASVAGGSSCTAASMA